MDTGDDSMKEVPVLKDRKRVGMRRKNIHGRGIPVIKGRKHRVY